MEQLSLSFLGALHVQLGKQHISKFRSVNVQALLIFLAMQPERPFSRDVLATLLWPDETEKVTRTNFRQTLYQLRKLLEPEQDPERPFLLISRQTVQFNPDSPTQLDVTHFRQAVDRRDLQTAVDAYTGELLPGFACDSLAFEAWLRQEREHLHGLALENMSELTERNLLHENFSAAKEIAHRQLQLEPWREVAHRQIMRALALNNDRQAALAQFARCQAVLEDELGVEPDEETVALAEQIKQGEMIGQQTAVLPLHNLINPLTPYFGRQETLNILQQRLTDHNQRLITVAGAGGMGKTRLAIELGWELKEQFTDGVWFVPLAPVPANESIIDGMADAIANSLGQSLRSNAPPSQQVIHLLGRRHLLLILDNLEHLLEATPFIKQILENAPGVTVLATSREPLNLMAELYFPLQPLGHPPKQRRHRLEKETVKFDQFPAVALFADRAMRANGRFQSTADNQPTIAELCYLLGGMPLAIELAAATLRRLSLDELITAVRQSLDTLQSRYRDIPERHRSLRGIFETAWRLLTPTQQTQLRDLAYFRGDFDPSAAMAVCQTGQAALFELVEKSLLVQENGRFRLHELLRQFVREHPADETTIPTQHATHYLTLVAEQQAGLNGRSPKAATDQIEAELDNVRQAWETAVQLMLWEPLKTAVRPLSLAMQIRGRYQEGERLFRQASEAAEMASMETAVYFRTQQAAMLVRLARYPDALTCIKNALPHATDAWLQARLLITQGEAYWRQSQLDAAEAALNDGLAQSQAMPDPTLMAIATFHLGVLHDLRGNHAESLTLLETALDQWQTLENLRWQGFTLNSIGTVAKRLSKFDQAHTALTQALSVSHELQDYQGQASTLNNLSSLETLQENYLEAKRLLLDALRLAESINDPRNLALTYHNLAWTAKQAGRLEEAKQFATKAVQKRREIADIGGEGMALRLLGEIETANNHTEMALAYFESALSLSRQVGDRYNEQMIHQLLRQLDSGIDQKRE